MILINPRHAFHILLLHFICAVVFTLCSSAENIATEYRYAEGKVDRLPELAAELVRPTIVAAGGMTVIRAAKSATQTIPMVMPEAV